MTFGVDPSHLVKLKVKEGMCFESQFLATESVTDHF